jgi:hypothetical protein
MSKEAMQAVALYKGATAGALNCLLWMAIYSRDEEPPFRSIISQRTLANLANMTERGIRKALDQLRTSGAMSSEPSGRTVLYTLNLPAPDPVEYGAIFAPSQYRNPSTAIAIPEPQYRSRDEPPEPQFRSPEPTEELLSTQQRNPSSTTEELLGISTYMRNNEKREEKRETPSPVIENLRRQPADAEETPTPHPPSPDQARQLWASAVAILKTEMSEAQYDSWLARVAATWARDGVLRLGVRSSHAAEMLETRYSDRISAALLTVAGEPVKFVAVKG